MSHEDPPMVHTPHVDHAYERELNAVSVHVARMADYAEHMVRDAILALLSRDEQLAQKVRDADKALDAMEIQCDDLCVKLMARRAPVGSDLRMITSVLKLVTDLERIGDLAVNIVKRTDEFRRLPELPKEVADLGSAVVEEVGVAVTALKNRDARLARELRDRDASTDARNRAAFDRLMKLAAGGDEARFGEILAATSVCRHLERIGDHSVNVAEMVIYMVEGTVVRHQG